MLNDDQIADLKAKHGDNLMQVIAPDGSVCVFRAPKRGEYDRWFDKRDGGSSVSRELAQSCLVYPDRDGMIAVLDKYPALLVGKGGFVDTITDMAGMTTAGAESKKL